MKLKFIRHASTNQNERGIIAGNIDVYCSKNGLKKLNSKIIIINNDKDNVYCYCSPKKRTIETAEYLCQSDFIISDLIGPRDYKDWSGKSITLFRSDENHKKEIELDEQIIERINTFLKQIKEKHTSKDEIYVITHSSIIKIVSKILNNKTIDNVKNLEIYEFEI